MTVRTYCVGIAKISFILSILYFFICSLQLLSMSFRLMAGKMTGDLFSAENMFLANPIVGLMIGILGTVLLQSSSTFTSIIISMIGTVILDPEMAVPMVMGSNIGTSVTNTIVSLTQAADRDELRLSFAAATVHDMFNWCAVITLLPIEILTKWVFGTGLLYYICVEMTAIVFGGPSLDAGNVRILGYITDPFVKLIVQTDPSLITAWAGGEKLNCTLVRHFCPQQPAAECWEEAGSSPYCGHLFAKSELEDWEVGLILVFVSLFTLCGSLLAMVKILHSLLQGTIAVAVKRVLNPTFQNRFANYMWGYVNILVGAILTFVVQSSSVFTSTLTPMVGIGLLTVETCYPLFLGSNIGSTTTALLAALAAESDTIRQSITIAFVHLFFNVFAMAIFYALPCLRFPIGLCKILGNTTAKYRWFAMLYLLVMFLLLPAFVMVTSLNMIVFMVINVPLLLLLVFVIVLTFLQRLELGKKVLPKVLLNWDFLPRPFHSLGFYDHYISDWPCCKKFRNQDTELA